MDEDMKTIYIYFTHTLKKKNEIRNKRERQDKLEEINNDEKGE